MPSEFDREERPATVENSDPPLKGPDPILDWRVLVALFVFFRLAAAAFLKPGGYLYTGGLDVVLYRRFAEFFLEGHYPFLHYWVEYPPVFPWISVGIYWLSLRLPAPSDMFWFQFLLSTFLTICEVGNLILIYRLAEDVWGKRIALRSAFIYAAFFVPLYSTLNWFDSFPLFFLLLTLWLAIRERYWLAGVAVGLGFMTKLIPVISAAAVLRYANLRQRGAYLLAACLCVFVIALPFLLLDPQWLIASFVGTLTRASWETVWALLEGSYSPGFIAPVPDRFNYAAAFWTAHPSTLPWPIINAAFFVSLIVLLVKRPALPYPRSLVLAVAISLNLFLIFSKGYSPQFLVYPLALLAVLLPNGRGVFYALVLSAANLVEWPLYFVHFPKEGWLLWGTVIARTIVLVVLVSEYSVTLFSFHEPAFARLRRRLAMPVFCLLGLLALYTVVTLGQHAFATQAQPALVDYVRSLPSADRALVSSSRDAFYKLAPHLRDFSFLLSAKDTAADDRLAEARVRSFVEARSNLWLVFDHSEDVAQGEKLAKWLDSWGSRATDTYFGPWQLIGYVPLATAEGSPSALNLVFSGGLVLAGYDLSPKTVHANGRFRLVLDWSVMQGPDKDYKVFLHLLRHPSPVPLAQADKMLLLGGLGSSKWQSGNTVRQGYDISLPHDLAPGQYTLIAGLYDPANGQRLSVRNENGEDDKVIIDAITVVK